MPREVIGRALAAFDMRRPGVEVLNQVHDTHEPSVQANRGEPRELCFSSDSATVTLRVTPGDDGLRVHVDGVADLVLALEQLDASGQVACRSTASGSFEAVGPGFVRVLGTRPGSSTAVWCTAWVQL